jgi:hypothetical protein
MTEADCAALIARGAERIAQWREANIQRRAEEDARARDAQWWAEVEAKQKPTRVVAFRKVER